MYQDRLACGINGRELCAVVAWQKGVSARVRYEGEDTRLLFVLVEETDRRDCVVLAVKSLAAFACQEGGERPVCI
jgi:hypothetical protein